MEVGSATAAPQTKSNSALSQFSDDFDNFLTIFVAQLENQDPLEPQDSSEFTNQIATLTGVEQQINTNSNLEELINLSLSQQNGNLVSYIGKEVEAKGSLVNLQAEGDVAFAYELEEAPEDVFITVRNPRDPEGRAIFNGTGSTNVGRNVVRWDGLDNDGNRVTEGVYELQVSFLDAEENLQTVTTYISGTVQGINMQAETPSVIVNNEEINIADIRFIGQERS